MRKYITLLRAKQYVKNLFILAPLFFSFTFYDTNKIIVSFYAFIAFSFTASSIYIFNDFIDITEDRNHPVKKKRPLASGEIKVSAALTIAFLMLIASLVFALKINLLLFYILLIYVFSNIIYSIKLKHVAIIDIIILAFGFVLRIFAGAVVINVEVSMWIIIITFLLTLFLSIAKRKEDVILQGNGQNTRKNIDNYNIEFINASMVLMASVIIVAYILFTVSPEVEIKFGTKYLYITSFFVVIGILKYMQLVFVKESSSDPTELIFKSKFLQMVILLWLLSFYLIIKV